MGNHVFFHDRLLEQWVKMCSFDFITKDRGLVFLHNYEAGLHDICATLDARDYMDYILYRNMSNVHVIISKEKTSTSGYFDVYVYDGNFLKSWFDDELHSTERRVLALIYWLDQFLTLALNILILSIFYISVDLSTNYFAHFSGC